MISRKEFSKHISDPNLSHVDRAVALLYYYRESQQFNERSVSELASDLRDKGFPLPNVTRLKEGLTKSRFTTKGSKNGFFRIDLRYLSEIASKYEPLLQAKKVEVTKHIIPPEWVSGTRVYLEKMVFQINCSFEFGLYDSCAVLMRRLMESLIIETYIHENRHHEIQSNGTFWMLERLVSHISADKKIVLSRNTPKAMAEIKQLGDTAAHDRTYITPEIDITDSATKFRRLIQELLVKSGIHKPTP